MRRSLSLAHSVTPKLWKVTHLLIKFCVWCIVFSCAFYYYIVHYYCKYLKLKTKLKNRTNAGTATFHPRGLCG